MSVVNNNYFTSISSDIPAQELANTKNLTLTFIACLNYIYKNKITGATNEAYETWLKPDAINSFPNSTFLEGRCKKFLNQFRTNFDALNELPCFDSVRSFAPTGNHNIYSERESDRKIFNLNRYMEALTRDGKIKGANELIADSSTMSQIVNAIGDYETHINNNYPKRNNPSTALGG